MPAALERIAEVILLVVALRHGHGIVGRTSTACCLISAGASGDETRRAINAPADAVREVESRIYGVLQWPIGLIVHVVAWEGIFHVLAVAEVWLVLRLLAAGDQITLIDAFLLESAGRFVTIAFNSFPIDSALTKPVPARFRKSLDLAQPLASRSRSCDASGSSS